MGVQTAVKGEVYYFADCLPNGCEWRRTWRVRRQSVDGLLLANEDGERFTRKQTVTLIE